MTTKQKQKAQYTKHQLTSQDKAPPMAIAADQKYTVSATTTFKNATTNKQSAANAAKKTQPPANATDRRRKARSVPIIF